MWYTLCDKNGDTLLGSDGHVYVSGKLSQVGIQKDIKTYRDRFSLHFEHKFKFWTHYFRDNNKKKLFPIDG